jgi:hypothetical protein
MKGSTIICFSICFWLGLSISTLAETNLLDRLATAKAKLVKMQDVSSGVPFNEIQSNGKVVNALLTQIIDVSFTDQTYDRTDSFFMSVLKRSDIVQFVVPDVCVKKFIKTTISSGERARLCNFMIQTLYENRLTNTQNVCNAIKSILYLNDYPEVYSPETREIIKKLILENRIHFFYADVLGIIKDKEIQAYLLPIANQEGRYKESGYYQTWLATCMLAKAGDKVARKRIEDEADNLSDLHKSMYIPLGMAYLGDRDMVLHLFEMLKSDLKKWNGEDVDPEETQLSHEAAKVLSLCVRSFPRPSTSRAYTTQDKTMFLKWVEENKNTFVLENKPPLYYLKNTRIGFLTK